MNIKEGSLLSESSFLPFHFESRMRKEKINGTPQSGSQIFMTISLDDFS